jgi:hypothetical protein
MDAAQTLKLFGINQVHNQPLCRFSPVEDDVLVYWI